MRRSSNEPTAGRQTAASAYRSDITGGRTSVSTIDGTAIVIATIVDQIPLVTGEDPARFLADANKMALDALAAHYPDQLIPRALPGNLEIGPLLALSEAIKSRLPMLAAFLADRLMDVHFRLLGEERGALGDDDARDRVDVEAALERTVLAYNKAPQPALGGLSPEQVNDLLSGDWYESGPLRLNDDLSLHDLRGSPLLHDARTLLQHLANVGPLKATEAGNLSRAGVAALYPKLRIRDEYLDEGLKKVINESDHMWLEIVRQILGGAKLIGRRSGAFRITEMGRASVADKHAGPLFVILFVILFQQYDLTLLDRGAGEEEGLQSTIACTFYLLSKHGAAWQSAEALAKRAWMESSRDPVRPDPYPGFNRAGWVFWARVLRPLVLFGLMEERETGSKLDSKREYRVTPLFRRFLRFDSPDTGRPARRFPLGVQ